MKIEKENYTLYSGNCIDILKTLPANSIDSCVCDPPYGLEFMGKEWDKLGAGVEKNCKSAGGYGKDSPTNENAFAAARIRYGKNPGLNMQEWHTQWAKEVYRVLKPGGFALVFGGSRTYHRVACGLEDAGFEIRDTIMWVYGSGFPKNLDVSKAIDKKAGAEREVISKRKHSAKPGVAEFGQAECEEYVYSKPSTEEAQQWDGWGTALKPAYEPICVARKPLEGTVADNVLKYGTGAINIDECRVEGIKDVPASPRRASQGAAYSDLSKDPATGSGWNKNIGRWPANFIHDGSEEVTELFPQSKGQQGDIKGTEKSRTGGEGTNCYSEYGRIATPKRGDKGSAARFFYCAKASRFDREEGLEEFQAVSSGFSNGANIAIKNEEDYDKATSIGLNRIKKVKNDHPTVKPTSLMRYLCKLVTQPGGTILDCFLGSGSTGKAAILEGFNFIGIDKDEHYVEIAAARIEFAKKIAEEEAEKEQPQLSLFAEAI